MIFFRNINWTPLICASSNGNTEIVELLLSFPNIDINCKSILNQNDIIKFEI